VPSDPRIDIQPARADTLGPLAADFMADHGVVLDDWQRHVLDGWLAVDRAGHYSAPTCGLSVPRQNGKTVLLKARAYFGAAVLGEAILYTAHEVKTYRKTFEELAGDFDPATGYPDLAAQTEYIRRTNGQEVIKLRDWQDDAGEWHTGGRIAFSARSRTASLGFTFDCFFADEAQELTQEQMAALQPTISAGPLGNPQTILIGTPPQAGKDGGVFRKTRRSALHGDGERVSWVEWSVPEVGDTTDWDRVAAVNPALDVRLMRTAIQTEMDTMDADTFALMRLGWWSEATEAAETVIPAAAWADTAIDADEAPESGLLVYAAKFSGDGSRLALAVCLKPRDGRPPHVELVDYMATSSGTGEAARWLAERSSKAAQIVVDGVGNAQALIDRLRELGVPKRVIQRPAALEAAGAYAALVDAVVDHAVTHLSSGQKPLDIAATTCTKRRIGARGGWGFESTEEADAAIIEAVALAYRSAMTTKRDPERSVCDEQTETFGRRWAY